jgi:hypothetical protein
LAKQRRLPVPITAMDELAFVLHRSSGVQFDQNLPTDIHLYGTDLVLEAARLGKQSYGLDLPLLHNSSSYIRAYRPIYGSKTVERAAGADHGYASARSLAATVSMRAHPV